MFSAMKTLLAAALFVSLASLFARNFNAGKDGSTFFNATLSPTGAAGSFATALKITQNGVEAPTGNINSTLVVAIPAGTDCSAAPCTLAFKSDGGFGNCVQISTLAAAAAPAASMSATASTATGSASSGKKAGCGGSRKAKRAYRVHSRDFDRY